MGGIITAFFALCGNALDIISSNQDLTIEREEKYRSCFH
jgi:hypothetical protein